MSKRVINKEMMLIYDKHINRRGVTIGSIMRSSFNKGGLPLIEWLADNTPEGSTVSDLLASLALDAMDEENDR
jgi:hypothetical protein